MQQSTGNNPQVNIPSQEESSPGAKGAGVYGDHVQGTSSTTPAQNINQRGYVFFDTETTGIINERFPPAHHIQPRIVQLAAIVTDCAFKQQAQLCVLVRPQGYEIPAGATRVHGITTQQALDYGVPASVALAMFNNLCRMAGTLVAHNMRFDHFVVKGEYQRLGKPFAGEQTLKLCTMELSKNVVCLPPTDKMICAGVQGYKSPKLEEAYRFFSGKQLAGAHNALQDVKACVYVYRSLAERGLLPSSAFTTA